ncbi:MAG: histidine phosphotransferase family protein [Pseudomonadota bacterium]
MSQSIADPAIPSVSSSEEPLDAVALSALIASRLCHDLINPVGAIGSGLEVMSDDDMDDAMKDAAIDLIKNGGGKSVALLKFARLAYGAAGGRGAEIPMEEAEIILNELFEWSKADLNWSVPPGAALKEKVKAVLILAQFAGDCVPRGGVVSVREEESGYAVEAEGKRALLNEDLPAALAGVTTEMKAKFAPAYVVGLLAREAGGTATVERVTEEKVRFFVGFSR